jgi:hypothetical protein
MNEVAAARKTAWSPWMTAVTAVLVLAVGLMGLTQQADAAKPREHRPVAINSKFEAKTGIRITRISVVADRGLVDVRFVVLDPQKANRFVGDGDHTGAGKNRQSPPKLRSAKRKAIVAQLASMRSRNAFQAGQTYFLLYLNPNGKVRQGDQLDLSGGAAVDTYAGIPVE